VWQKGSGSIHPRAEKLERLADVMDLESGVVLDGAFVWERRLYEEAVVEKRMWRHSEQYRLGRGIEPDCMRPSDVAMSKTVAMRRVNKRLRACSKCKGMNVPYETEVCVGWGCLDASVVVVGQSAHKYAVRSDVPFVNESGLYLDAACYLSGMRRDRLFITNVVHCCVGEKKSNLDSFAENCLNYLAEELDIVQPDIVVAMGNYAIHAVGKVWGGKVYNTMNPAAYLYSSGGADAVRDWVVKLSDVFDKHIDRKEQEDGKINDKICRR